ncbi:hypothetical protein [Lysobacter capsici]|uniref:hypothetical protein n=1 Tax=Lysobacter capsici TaxID=435897 RepID=UPI0012FE61BD|nr:hypothetical protein [Lysobacter capsici]
MTIFELVKIALDELYAEGQRQYGAALDGEIIGKIAYLSKCYGALTSDGRAPIDYRDPATRFAYVYKYVAAHGDYVVQILQKFKASLGNGAIFNDENLRLTCVGGGPGSDIIAVLKYLDDNKTSEPVKKLTCYLLDKEQAWADTWTELDDQLNSDVSLHANFQPLDVTAPDSWASQRRFLQADLFTLSYFVSEVRSLDIGGVVTEFWKTLFAGAKPGAVFLYDDNGHTDFNAYFDQQWQGAGLECLISEDNIRLTPRFSEQASELGSYLTKFGQSPKLQSYISYRVLRKPT